MLVVFDTKNGTKRLFFTNKAGGRRALIAAFKAHQFPYRAPDVDTNVTLTGPFRDAYKLPQGVVDAMGDALKNDIETKRAFVRNVLAQEQVNFDAVELRDYILTLPIDEAIKLKVKVDGKNVNAVDHIAPILQKIYQRNTADGYTKKNLFEIQDAERA